MTDELLQDLAQYKTSKDKSKLSYKTRSLCLSRSLSCQGNLKCSFGYLKPDVIQIMEDWKGWKFFFWRGGGMEITVRRTEGESVVANRVFR